MFGVRFRLGRAPEFCAPQASSPSASGARQRAIWPRLLPLDQENAPQGQEPSSSKAFRRWEDRHILTIRDREQQGRGYSFHHGRATGGGGVFWSFAEFPDKERVEITKERDIAELYVGNKAWEITYKGPHPIEQKDLDDYLRRRRFSLDTILRTWVNDPSVVLLYEGFAIAGTASGDADHSDQRKR